MVFTTETKRIALFLIGCMGARSLMVYLAYQKSTRLYAALFTTLVAIGFMYIYLTGSRKTGPEVSIFAGREANKVFGDRIWWNDIRPLHATLYATASLMIWSNTYANDAWKVLLLDLFIGLFAFVNKHFF
jgi:hypothetical protein